MNHYRELNKELVEQVQMMRTNIKLYCEEITNLKAELMQKYESEAILRNQCYNWALENFTQLIQYIKPDSDILPILKDYVQPKQTTLSNSTEDRFTLRRRTSEERLSRTERKSSILRDLQRSNSLINFRKSLNCSPVSISSNDASDDNIDCAESGQQITNAAESLGSVQSGLIETGQPTQFHIPLINVVYDESEEQDEQEEENNSHEKSTLKDVTNTLKTESFQYMINKRRHMNNVHIKNQNERRDAMEICNSPVTDDTNTADKTKSCLRLTDNSVLGMEEETLQEPRKYISTEEINKTIRIPQDINEDIADITLRNFKDAACSTPNSLMKATSPVSVNISNRPSRQCKPKNLSEPPLRTKMRRENEPKIKCKTKSKSRKKNN